jgi:hypothetical protein
MTTLPPLSELVDGFIDAVEGVAETRTRNVLAASLGRWTRYREWLTIIVDRLEQANAAAAQGLDYLTQLKPGQVQQGPQVTQFYQQMNQANSALHLEIESFYVFAKILLDRIADTWCFYFNVTLPGLGSSHSRLSRRFTTICADRGVPPEPLAEVMARLTTSVVEVRTDVIEHQENPRHIPGTLWDPGKQRVRLVASFLYPENISSAVSANREVRDPRDVLPELDAYAVGVLGYFIVHATQSIIGKPIPQRGGQEPMP